MKERGYEGTKERGYEGTEGREDEGTTERGYEGTKEREDEGTTASHRPIAPSSHRVVAPSPPRPLAPSSHRTLVTGSSGFIASRVCELLLEKGETVVGLDSMNDSYDVRLKEHRLQRLLKYPGFTFYRANIEHPEEIRPIFEAHSFRSVFHLAARAGVRYSMENPEVYLRTNTMGTLNLLQFMREFGIQKFILASTSSLYAGLPMPFTEDLPVNTPISPYAASKKAAEMLAYTYHLQFGIDVSILRYFTVFGPGGRPDMAPDRFVKQILSGTPITLYGDGSQSRDFTYIDDIARGTLMAEKPLGYQIINLGGGHEPVSINQFIHWIEELTHQKAIINYQPFHPSDMKCTMASIDKARRLLNWEPMVSTYAGLKNMIDQFHSLPRFIGEFETNFTACPDPSGNSALNSCVGK